MKNEYIENMIEKLNHTYYAHIKADGSKELLAFHLKLTYEYYEKMEKSKNLGKIVKNIIYNTFHVRNEISEEIYELFKQAIYYHDIGKINPLFQKNKMNNDLKVEITNNDDTHSALSARIYIDSILDGIKKENRYTQNEKVLLIYVAYYFGYIISRHHTKLESIGELLDAIKNKEIPEISKPQKEEYEKWLDLNRLEKIITNVLQIEAIEMYILCKLLYSFIITADFYATYEYMTGKKVEFEIPRKEELFKKYANSDLINKIRKYEKNEIEVEEINRLRSDIFLEAEKTLKENLDKNIFYLEAPTGAGKTNMAINLAKILYEENKNLNSIHYIFPFINIIEQTDNTFQKYFKKYDDYIVINSISSMAEDTNEKLDYEAIYTKNVFNQYPIVITSHVNLFNTLFGIGKEKNYGLYNYINSVVILDEIQAYSNNIWKEMIEMFDKYATLLNIKFIIMSATLPRLDNLINKKISNFCVLIKDSEKFYKSKVFSKRVTLNYELLENTITMNELVEKIGKIKRKKVLVECIRKNTAEELYQKLKEINENTYIMTGDDNKCYRNIIIQKTKTDLEMILVATQTIEAGVDIDMDIGFKDISFLDSEEQFLGRINRSNKKKNCLVYFFNLDEARVIYRKDKRLQYNLKNEENRRILESKNFNLFYNKIIDRINEEADNYTEKNIENFKRYCKMINFRKIDDIMTLIETKDTVDIFINYTVNIENEKISGKEVFEQYKEIYTDDSISYAEKKVKLSQISEKLNLFVYSIYEREIDQIEGEKILGMYYVEDGEKYIEDGRFNKTKYLRKGEELFL